MWATAAGVHVHGLLHTAGAAKKSIIQKLVLAKPVTKKGSAQTQRSAVAAAQCSGDVKGVRAGVRVWCGLEAWGLVQAASNRARVNC